MLNALTIAVFQAASIFFGSPTQPTISKAPISAALDGGSGGWTGDIAALDGGSGGWTGDIAALDGGSGGWTGDIV